MNDIKKRMEGAINTLHHEFSGLRTGRASAALLDPITVDAYGSPMPINQVGSVSVPDPRMLTIQVWDKSLVPSVEKAINESNLGINPMSEGQLIRLPMPALNEERRKELSKLASKYTEDAKIAIRNIRRDAVDQVKKAEKNGEISEDEMHDQLDEIQNITDEFTKKADDAFKTKEKDIMEV